MPFSPASNPNAGFYRLVLLIVHFRTILVNAICRFNEGLIEMY